VLQDFGEHGREFITSEVGLKFLEVLGDAQQLSQLVGGGRRAARLQTILQHCAFKVRLWGHPQQYKCLCYMAGNSQVLWFLKKVVWQVTAKTTCKPRYHKHLFL
jgi:hypothetical protein